MQLDLIVMVRNEADIWGEFLAHACSLFDRITVIDHQSTDGTQEITQDFVKLGAPLEVYRYTHRKYLQSELSNTFARRSFANGADWVFFLDADEFLEIQDRSSLKSSLHASRAELVKFSWKNLVPTKFGSFKNFDLTQEFRWTGACSDFGKVAICKAFASRYPSFRIHQGNHEVSAGGENRASADSIAAILHVPIRSVKRFRYKLAWGVAAYKGLRAKRKQQGTHWFELYERMKSGVINAETLNGLAAHYGKPLNEMRPIDPIAAGWPQIYVERALACAAPTAQKKLSSEETKRRDLMVAWDDRRIFIRSGVSVVVANRTVKIANQPVWRSVKNVILKRIAARAARTISMLASWL